MSGAKLTLRRSAYSLLPKEGYRLVRGTETRSSKLWLVFSPQTDIRYNAEMIFDHVDE